MKNTCETCRFWEEDTRKVTEYDGYCRFKPPVVMIDDSDSDSDSECFTVWPGTENTDWCGEYRPGNEGVIE